MIIEIATSCINLFFKYGDLGNKTLLSKPNFAEFDRHRIPSHKCVIPCFLAGDDIYGMPIYHEHCELLEAFGIRQDIPEEKEGAACTGIAGGAHSLEVSLVTARN